MSKIDPTDRIRVSFSPRSDLREAGFPAGDSPRAVAERMAGLRRALGLTDEAGEAEPSEEEEDWAKSPGFSGGPLFRAEVRVLR